MEDAALALRRGSGTEQVDTEDEGSRGRTSHVE